MEHRKRAASCCTYDDDCDGDGDDYCDGDLDSDSDGDGDGDDCWFLDQTPN